MAALLNATGCLDENAAVDFVAGCVAPDQARIVEEHLDRCPACRLLVAHLAQAPSPAGAAASGPAADWSRGAHELGVGQVLAERFRLRRLVGQGGMGVVYEAYDELLRTRVAVKLLRPEIASVPALLKQLHREILVGRRIAHPNVCRLHDLGTSQGLSFITMEFLTGETLAVRLGRGRLPVAAAEELVDEICAALDAAHREGVIHRDLKPGNIMVDENGRAKVMDFGLARDLSGELSQASIPVGTPGYWAPEQARGEAATPASDVYALGLIAYEMLTGARFSHGRRPSLEAVPIRYRRLVARCLKERPGDRFPSAAAARAELARARRHGSRRLAVALVVGLASCALGLGLWHGLTPRPRPPEPARPVGAGLRGAAARGQVIDGALRPEAPRLDAAALEARRARLLRAARSRFLEVSVYERHRQLVAAAEAAILVGDLPAAEASLAEAAALLSGEQP